jgi:hypothetical protein
MEINTSNTNEAIEKLVNHEASNTQEAIEKLVNDEAYDFLINLTPAKVDNVLVNAHLQGYIGGKEKEMLALLYLLLRILVI